MSAGWNEEFEEERRVKKDLVREDGIMVRVKPLHKEHAIEDFAIKQSKLTDSPLVRCKSYLPGFSCYCVPRDFRY